MFEHAVGDAEHFSHGSDDRDLGRLPLFAQMFVEGPDRWIAADDDDRCHVEDATHREAAAGDMRLSAHEAAVAVHGRDAYERCDLLLADVAEFGKLGDERCGGDSADAGDGPQERCPTSKAVILLNLLGDLDVSWPICLARKAR